MLATVKHILPLTVVQRTRVLPVEGKVLVRAGTDVKADDVVATAILSPRHRMVDVARGLNVSENRADRLIERRVGEMVDVDDIIASRGGVGRRVVRAPVPGKIVFINLGKVLIQEKSSLFKLRAHFPGVVSDLIPDRGVVIENTGVLIQGAWGNGKVDFGLITVLANAPDHHLTGDQIDISLRGAIVLAGYCDQPEVLQNAAEHHVRGFILSAMTSDLIPLANNMPYPIILTDGFGRLPMNSAAFELLSTNEKREATLNAEPINFNIGSYPEVFIPLPGMEDLDFPTDLDDLMPGRRVMITRAPNQGEIGTVEAVLPNPVTFPSGLRAEAARIAIEGHDSLVVPVANLVILD